MTTRDLSIADRTDVVLKALRENEGVGVPYAIDSNTRGVRLQMNAGAAGFLGWVELLQGEVVKPRIHHTLGQKPYAALTVTGDLAGVQVGVTCIFHDPDAISLIHVMPASRDLAVQLNEEGLR